MEAGQRSGGMSVDAEDKRTGEIVIPVSLDSLALVHRITLSYMRIKGMFYALIGATWIIFQSPSRLAGIEWLDILSPTMVGLMWLIPGVACMALSWIKSFKLHRVAWFLLILIPALLGGYFFISWALYFLPVNVPGYQRGGITTVSYWAYSASA